MFTHPRHLLDRVESLFSAEPQDEVKSEAVALTKKHLWVVAYVNQDGRQDLVDAARQDIENSFEGGADAVVLINEWCSLKELEYTLEQTRKVYPQIPLGVNYLGDEVDGYGFHDSFRLAREFNLKLVWTDFSGVDLIEERPEVSLHAIATEKPKDVFYCSGIHMKYSTLKNPQKSVEQSALQAMGWVDGIIMTGEKTGVPVDAEKMQRVRKVIGNYPLGVASGVTSENVHLIRDACDFFLVASSLQDEHKRIVLEKVRKLRLALNQ